MYATLGASTYNVLWQGRQSGLEGIRGGDVVREVEGP